jgi:chaperonin GroES
VLVQRVKAEAKTAGGIFLPESAVKELNEAKVLAVGPGGFDKDGKRIQCSVQAGDKVLIPQVRDTISRLFEEKRFFNEVAVTDWCIDCAAEDDKE